MRKKKLILPVCTACLITGLGILSSCNQTTDGIVFNVEGGEVARSVTAELGDLFIIPKVSATKEGEELDVTVQVFDSAENDVELKNKKFKATDTNGYKIIFTATDGNEEKSIEMAVSVQDTKAPTFSIQGTSGMVIPEQGEVIVPSCKVIDASSEDLTYAYKVVSPQGAEISVTDGKFTVSEIGDYMITYSAEDLSGNKGTSDFIVSCKKAVVLNDFDSEEDFGYVWGEPIKTVETDLAIAGNGLKITFTKEGAWGRICVPFKKADGSFWSWEDVQELQGIQLYVYSSTVNEFGLALAVKSINAGKNTLYFSMDEIKANYIGTPDQYKENEEGFYLNIRSMLPDDYIVLDYMIGVYADDYVPSPRFKVGEFEKLPELFTADYGGTFPVPSATASREGVPMHISVKVTDSNGTEISVPGGVFDVSDLAGYTIEYTATDDIGSKTLQIPLSVTDTRIPRIEIAPVDKAVKLGSVFTVPESTVSIVTGETLETTVTVYDPEGEEITLTDNRVNATKVGKYTLRYYTKSELNGNATTLDIIIRVFDGEDLNGFTMLSDVTWSRGTHTVYQGTEGAGIKVTGIDGAWQPIYVPLKNSEGNYLLLNELLDFEYVDIYLYLSKDMRIGGCAAETIKDLSAGQNILRLSAQEIRAGIQADGNQYSENANGFYINIAAISAQDYIILENFVGIYGADYVPKAIIELADGTELPVGMSVNQNEEFTVPTVKAHRKGSETEMSVSVKVFDSSEKEITMTDRKFTATDLGGYTVVYTVSDDKGSSDFKVQITVKDKRVPQITVSLTENIVKVGEEVSIPVNTVTIATGETLQAIVTVFAPDGTEVSVENGKFIPLTAGKYTIRYFAESENGNSSSEEVEIIAAEGDLLNGFTNVNDITWIPGNISKEIASGVEGFGVKVSGFSGSWISVYMPLTDEEGNYISLEDLYEYEKLEVYVYLSTNMEIGLATGDTIKYYEKGHAIITITAAELRSGVTGDPDHQYNPNANGIYINLKQAQEGDYIVFKKFFGVYAKDYVAKVVVVTTDGTDLPTEIKAIQGEEVSVPVITAHRKKSDVAMTVNVKVSDPEGEEIVLTDNKFTATVTGKYTVEYTVYDNLGSEVKTVEIIVSAADILLIETMAKDGTKIFLNDIVTVPSATASYGEKTVDVALKITDPDGSTVTVTEGKFTAAVAGNYTFEWTAVAENGTSAMKKVTYECINGKLLSGFDNISCVQWTPYSKELTVEEDGVKMSVKSTASWARTCLPFKKADGTFYTKEEITAFDSIELTVTTSKSMTLGLAVDTLFSVNGKTTITFTREQLLSALEKTADQYSENDNGFYLTLNGAEDGDFIIFHSFVGRYADQA